MNISGGVKSLVQLTTLGIIEKQIGLGIPIQAFFDLVIGTRYVITYIC